MPCAPPPTRSPPRVIATGLVLEPVLEDLIPSSATTECRDWLAELPPSALTNVLRFAHARIMTEAPEWRGPASALFALLRCEWAPPLPPLSNAAITDIARRMRSDIPTGVDYTYNARCAERERVSAQVEALQRTLHECGAALRHVEREVREADSDTHARAPGLYARTVAALGACQLAHGLTREQLASLDVADLFETALRKLAGEFRPLRSLIARESVARELESEDSALRVVAARIQEHAARVGAHVDVGALARDERADDTVFEELLGNLTGAYSVAMALANELGSEDRVFEVMTREFSFTSTKRVAFGARTVAIAATAAIAAVANRVHADLSILPTAGIAPRMRTAARMHAFTELMPWAHLWSVPEFVGGVFCTCGEE